MARHVFAEQGFHPTSMNDLAEAAGVTKPVLYQHFRSKRQLYLVLLDDVGSRLLEPSPRPPPSGRAPGTGQSGFGAYFASSPTTRWRSGPLRRRNPPRRGVRRQGLQVEENIAETIANLIDVEGLEPGGRRLLAHGIVGLAEGTSRHWLAGGLAAGDPDAHATLLGDLAWAGLHSLAVRSSP